MKHPVRLLRRRTRPLAVANLRRDDGNRDAHMAWLWRRVGKRLGRILTQEDGDGHGEDSTHVYGRGLSDIKVVELGDVGAHRWAYQAEETIAGHRIVYLAVHLLHLATQGKAAQDAMLDALADLVARLEAEGALVVLGGDWNRFIGLIAARVGGTAYGKGIGGLVVSKGLKVRRARVLNLPLRKRWSDHATTVGTLVVPRRRRAAAAA